MKNRILLVTIGAAALAAITFNVNAGTTLLSPRAAGNQIKTAPGIAAAQSANTVTVSPRALGNQTTTVASVVNDHRLAEIADLLFQHDHILSVMFQPAAYAGSAARLARPAEAVTIPDVIGALKGAGQGTISADDFSPLPCSHPACFSLAFYLKMEDKRYKPIKQMVNAERYLDLIQNRAIFGTDAESFQCVTDAVYDLWSGPAALSPDSRKALDAIRKLLA